MSHRSWNIGSQSCFHKIVHNCLWHHPMSPILPGCPSSLLPIQTMIICIDETSRPASISVNHPYQSSISHLSSHLTHFRIISTGTDSSADNTFLSRSSSLDDGGYWRYTRFACPQHCSMKLSSQWNLGKKIASKHLVLHAISRVDS